MKTVAKTLAVGALILVSNTVAVAFALFLVFTSRPDPWIHLLVAVVIGFISGLVVEEVQFAFVGSLACFVTSLVVDAALAGAFTYLYPVPGGAVRQLMATLFLRKALLPALVIFLPVYLLSWVAGALFSEYLVH